MNLIQIVIIASTKQTDSNEHLNKLKPLQISPFIVDSVPMTWSVRYSYVRNWESFRLDGNKPERQKAKSTI